MFVYYFVYVEVPFGQAEQAVLERLGALATIADESYRAGEAIRPDPGGDGLARVVRMEAGPAARGENETTVPLVWEATGSKTLFPRMDADLVIARVGERLTQVSFRGSYTPPFGRVGRTLDRAVMHRVAEAVVKRFVDATVTAVDLRAPA